MKIRMKWTLSLIPAITLLIVLVSSVVFIVVKANKVRISAIEATLAKENDEAHLKAIATKLQKAEKGDFIVYKWKDRSSIVVFPDEGQGTVLVSEYPNKLVPTWQLSLSSRFQIAQIQDVVSKYDTERWAPLARKFYGLD
ncbi:MAG: hypothetical protein KBC26_01220 [Candidatus Pacebacteria bacterium]|nr:hypothetical protein [Candidatus Paceibacterota bacterium]